MAEEGTLLVGARWPSLADARELVAVPVAEDRHTPRVSLYLDLPERPGFADLRGLRTGYEGAVHAAARRMQELGLDRQATQQAAEQLLALELHAASLPPARGSLAVFLGEDRRLSAFVLDRDAGPATCVGRSFRLRPLLAEVQSNRRYRVLALAINRVQLFEGDSHALRPCERDGVPSSLVDALGAELDGSLTMGHVTNPGASSLIRHGHGSANEERRIDLDRYYHAVAAALARLWPDRRDPLVLFADKSHHGRFHKKAAGLAGLLEESVAGHPERASAQEIHQASWPVALAHVQREERRAAALVRDAVSNGGTVVGLEASVLAAMSGRVVRLWIDAALRVPKHVDPRTGELVEPWGDEDALDEVAAYVVARGGTVAVCSAAEMPTPAGVAAELRG
jgi:hypothetical protein